MEDIILDPETTWYLKFIAENQDKSLEEVIAEVLSELPGVEVSPDDVELTEIE